jgi:predicted permease
MPTTIRLAVRALAKTPGYSAAVIVVLMLGIGANSAVFSALDQIVIRPLPYADPDRLAAVWEDFSALTGTPKARVSPATYFDWQKRNRSYSDLAAYRSSGLTVTGDGEPEALSGIAATANLIPMLGVRPLMGRIFTADEEQPGNRLVVISHRLWRRRLAGDPAVLGRSLRLNDEPYAVIGVMEPGFLFPDSSCDYWIPIGLTAQLAARRNSHFLHVVGRVLPGRSWADARADMNGIASQLASEYPASNERVGITVSPLKDDILAGTDTSLLVLFAAAGCVLLIACANVANLALARGSRRQHEVLVRMALGASRRRIAADMLLESALLATAGAAAGLILARWELSGLQWLVPAGVTGATHLEIDTRAVLFAAMTAAATVIAFGAAPIALQTAESALSSVSSANPRIAGRPGGRLREGLVVLEVALALVLLVAAGLLVETLVKLRTIDTGFRAERVLTADIEAPLPKYADAAVRRRFYESIAEKVAAIPGVDAVGLTSDLPYTSRGNTMSIRIEHREQESGIGQDALFRLVSPGYLRTIGARLMAGRLLAQSDSSETTPVVVINQSFVRQYFGGSNPLGQRIDSGTGTDGPIWMTIVGIVADVRERGADLETKPAVYVPFEQTAISFFQPSEIAVRTSVTPFSIANELRRAVWAVDPQQPVSIVRTMDQIVDADLAGRQQVLTLVAAFSAVALLLAAVGLYSVLSYIVVQTKREIGVRIAIGASPGTIVKSVLRQAAILTAGGVTAGLLSSVAVTRLLASQLYEVSPLDPRVLGGMSAAIAAIALLAAYVPARRAAATDPLVVLRGD